MKSRSHIGILLGTLVVTALIFMLRGVALLAGSQQDERADSDWSPNTSRLDDHVKVYHEWGDLAQDVKAFYDLLRRKEWSEVYKRHTQAFRSSNQQSYYVETMENESKKKRWQLLDYEILSVNRLEEKSTLIICRFVEAPGEMRSYRAVCWKKEDGKWRCEEAGPTLLPLFSRSSPFCCTDEVSK